MEQVATTTVAGWVRGKFHDFSTDEILPPQAVDRLEEDDALLSRAIVELHRLHHYPIISTTSHTMGATASADTVTLEDNVTFAVGGVVFDTHSLDTRALTIPDNATRFLRAEVDAACGDLIDYGDPANGVQVDPLVRKLVCKLILTEGAETDAEGTGGGPSSPTSMRILKAIKAAAGTLPVITLYANDGLDPATSVATHEARDPAHPASKIVFDNTGAALPGNPSRVQAAIEALLMLTSSTDRAGLIRLGTAAGAAALADASTAVTPALLGGLFTRSLSIRGYQLLPGGLILQWFKTASGGIPATGSQLSSYTWPISFPNAVLSVMATADGSGTSINSVTADVANVTVSHIDVIALNNSSTGQSIPGVYVFGVGY